MNSPHLDPRLAKMIADQEGRGVQLSKQPIGTVIEVKTANSFYRIKVLPGNRFEVKGGTYFPEPTEVTIPGSTWGGSMLKMNWIGLGMHIEFNQYTTSEVKSLKIVAPDGSWEYDI